MNEIVNVLQFTTESHRLPVVAHHTYVQLIAGGPLYIASYIVC